MDLAVFRVGSLPVVPGLVLAPMSGVTDAAFRRLVRECSPGAVGLVVSEFVSIEGLTRHDLKTLRMLRYDPGEHPIGIQIFGSDIDRMAEAALLVQETGVDLVDINCGCPVPKVVKRGGGAELLRRTEHLERMLRAVRRELSVPLTLKFRTGWDESSINCVDVARMAEASGVAMLTVHGRTRVQLYTGAADWERIAEVKRAVSIPVVGSGDVVSVATARSRLARSGVDGIAMRGMACRIARGFPGCGALREAVSRTRRSDELLEVLDRFEGGGPLVASEPPASPPGADSPEPSARSAA